ncbi:MAG: O-acetyl-ADP-ribose deacetylase [Candidatus Poribacteria bacterium]|nr:O-acetyl-ADP-ribose deacetylase [Candidatus Poribacteria bacterium]
MNETWYGDRIVVKMGDLTAQEVDAIVNAANSSLMGGGGVDGMIHRFGGSIIKDECRHIREHRYPDGLPTGKAVITTAGELPARYVIHTVGPVWQDGKHHEPELLRDCYLNSLKLAAEEGLKTVAFPAISTGIFGYPPEKAASVALQAALDFLGDDETLERVEFVLYGELAYRTFIDNARK